MSNVKLTYFPTRGIADIVRMLLYYGNIDFEDIRIPRDEWPSVRPSTPFGEMPVYEENGKVAWQSIAIARYLAKKVNLHGDSDWECLQIDAIGDTIADLRIKAVKIFYETDNEKREALKQTILAETLPYYLEKFEKIVSENGGHLVANKLTWVDILLTSVSELCEALLEQENIFEKYENLLKLKQEVRDIPAIKSFIENRPQSQY
nr:glutathione S-transferase 1 [Holotrichia parallela]